MLAEMAFRQRASQTLRCAVTTKFCCLSFTPLVDDDQLGDAIACVFHDRSGCKQHALSVSRLRRTLRGLLRRDCATSRDEIHPPAAQRSRPADHQARCAF